MDQISRPFLLVLLAVIGFAGAWMTVLRPKAESTADTPAATAAAPAQPASNAPGMKGLTRAVDKAKGAARASEASTAATQAADPETATPQRTEPAKTAAPPAPTPVVKPAPKAPERQHPAAASPKIVLLFAGSGADDAVARAVVRSVRRPGVRTIIASLSDAGKYRRLVGDVQIEIAPTILVIGRDRKARRIAGLPDAGQLRAALAAAR
jgi:hypothetical protein